MAEVADALRDHRDWLTESGEGDRRRTRRAREEIEALALTTLRRRWSSVGRADRLEELAAAVVAGERDPYTAADDLLAGE